MKKIWYLFAIAVIATSQIVSNIPLPVSAADLTPEQLEKKRSFAGANDVLYSDHSTECSESAAGGAGSTAPGGGTGGVETAGLTAEQAAFVDRYHDIAEKLSVEYGIPWETVMAQGILESGAGTSEFATQRNNFFGIGAFDSNPNNAFSYATPEEGWRGYFANIVKTETYRQHGAFQGANITDPYAYLRSIKDAGYATDPAYVAKVSPFIKAIEERSKQKGWASSAELAGKNPQMLSNAANNAGGGSPQSGGSPTPAPASEAGQTCKDEELSSPSGEITDVANEMGEWGNQYDACYVYGGGHASTEEIQKSIDNHFQGQYGVDCSGFVRAVIFKAKGADPGPMTTNSMCDDASKFERIPRSEAKPGDFSIDCDTHVEVITGVNSDGTFATVGSHSTGCGAGKGASPDAYQGTENFVLRYKG